jgi:hypothetical protein
MSTFPLFILVRFLMIMMTSVAASGYKLFLMIKFSCISKQKYRAYFYKILNALGKLMVK